MTTYRDINREVLRLAVPSILANITIPLVGIVDVAIIGHISSAAAVGGIAVGTMLFDLLYWNFGFLRVGTSGMTAQVYGRGDVPEQAKLLTQSMTIAFGGALGIWLLQWFFVTLVLYLMPCSPEVADFARQYFFVRVWAAPATLALFALKGWFIGMQNTIAPMITDIVVNVVNMVASYALAVYTPLGAIGVAWGTLIAQYTGLATAAVILAIHYKRHLSLIQIRESMRWSEMKHFFVLNTNLFLRSLAFMVIYVGYTIFMSAYGDTELAVSAIIMKIFMFFSYFIDGFAYAAEAMVGKAGVETIDDWTIDDLQSRGESQESRDKSQEWCKTPDVVRCVKVLSVWTIALGLVFTLLYYVFDDGLIALMTSDPDIQLAATAYYPYLWLMPVLSAFAFMFDGVFVGATMAIPVRNCMFASAALFVLTYITAAPVMGAAAMYLAYMIHLVVRTVYLCIVWFRL